MKKFHRDVLVSRIDAYKFTQILELFTRDQLRELAKKLDIPQGKNKADTIWNLGKRKEKLADHILEITLL